VATATYGQQVWRLHRSGATVSEPSGGAAGQVTACGSTFP